MKKIQIILVLLLLKVITFNLQAQQKNQINIHGGLGMIQKYKESPVPIVWGGSYIRSINSKWGIMAQYTSFNTLDNGQILNEFTQNDAYYKSDTGWDFVYNYENPISRYKVQSFDLGVAYTIFDKRKFQLIGNLGLSYVYSEAVYIDYIEKIQTFNGTLSDLIRFKKKNENYFGPKIGLMFNYYILHNRLNIGAHIDTRVYIGVMPNLSNIGVHVGFNF